jgi:outer membrane receptor protein involved in Fe transport
MLCVLVFPVSGESAIGEQTDVISEIVVTSQRRQQPRFLHAGNIDRLDKTKLDQVQHQHIHELLSRVAGVWIVRGSGQEHQTAMRSPVLGGAGSCGGFLLLEDGIPIRPANFCNINQLIEVNAEQAQSVEIIRGPGNALFGSNALHGIANFLMPMPGKSSAPAVAFELGANDFVRARAALPFDQESSWLASVIYANDNGFRDDSGYRQGKLHVKRSWSLQEGDFTAGLTATNLDQDTAGFIVGKDAYKDPNVRTGNPNPEAFRDASSLRLYGIWSRPLSDLILDVRPYLRYSDMEFMHHGLPGQPIEKNGHVSAGVVSAATFTGSKFHTVVGIDVEWSDMFLEQTQDGPTIGPPVQRETRPEGKHYDYSVVSLSAAPFVQTEYRFDERFSLGGGVRLEYAHYDYANQMLSGNTRDDGTPCGFGGCLYSRPPDRTDSFTNVALNLSASFLLSSNTTFFTALAQGFRAPQTLELYRLQGGQQLSDLESERIDSAELGLRTSHRAWSADVTAFAMRKRDSVFRDVLGFNINGARTRHIGIETAIDWQINAIWLLSADVSYARHTYDFNATGRGESFVAGHDIDTAPRWLGSVELLVEPTDFLKLGLQLTGIGDYYLEPGNRFRYSGHMLANLRATFRLSSQSDLVLRLNNIFDERVADRADFAAGNYRYLPGRGREAFIEIRYSPPEQE